jgi:5-methylcytosine-specific restriction endonuclease McrA
MNSKPKRGTPYWDTVADKNVWLYIVKTDGVLLVCDDSKFSPGANYEDRTPEQLTALNKPRTAINKSRKVKTPAATVKDQEERETQERRAVWYYYQLRNCTDHCENCKNRIHPALYINPRTVVAHIVPKAKFESVDTHPNNCWFACGDCHTNYDTKGAEYQANMAVAPVVIKRFKTFIHLLTPLEVKALPEWLYKVYNECN